MQKLKGNRRRSRRNLEMMDKQDWRILEDSCMKWRTLPQVCSKTNFSKNYKKIKHIFRPFLRSDNDERKKWSVTFPINLLCLKSRKPLVKFLQNSS